MQILAYVIGDDFRGVLAAAQDGSEEAFAVLWRDSHPALLRYLRVAAPEAAEDVARRDLGPGGTRAWRASAGMSRPGAAGCSRLPAGVPWTSAGRRARHPVAPLMELPRDLEPRTPDAAGQAIENLATEAALAAIAALPPQQAEVILLRVVAGLDTEAVARIVGRSPGAVRVAAHRGLRRLSQMIAMTGVTP